MRKFKKFLICLLSLILLFEPVLTVEADVDTTVCAQIRTELAKVDSHYSGYTDEQISAIATVYASIYATYGDTIASALCGNITHESNFKIDAVEGATSSAGQGVGLCQWSFGRRITFSEYCKTKGAGTYIEVSGIRIGSDTTTYATEQYVTAVGDLPTQVEYLIAELIGNKDLIVVDRNIPGMTDTGASSRVEKQFVGGALYPADYVYLIKTDKDMFLNRLFDNSYDGLRLVPVSMATSHTKQCDTEEYYIYEQLEYYRDEYINGSLFSTTGNFVQQLSDYKVGIPKQLKKVITYVQEEDNYGDIVDSDIIDHVDYQLDFTLPSDNPNGELSYGTSRVVPKWLVCGYDIDAFREAVEGSPEFATVILMRCFERPKHAETPDAIFNQCAKRGTSGRAIYTVFNSIDGTCKDTFGAVVSETIISQIANNLYKNNIWNEDNISTFAKLTETNLTGIIEQATLENLSQDELESLHQWQLNIDEGGNLLTAMARRAIILLGIAFIIWGVFFIIAYIFDRLNTFLPIKLTSLLSAGRLDVTWDGSEITYFGERDANSKHKPKTINGYVAIALGISAMALGILIITGYLFKLLASILLGITNFLGGF